MSAAIPTDKVEEAYSNTMLTSENYHAHIEELIICIINLLVMKQPTLCRITSTR